MSHAAWHFRQFRPGDTVNDPIQRALFSQESVTSHPASALVREAIQNSLDARPDNRGIAKVRFAIRRGSEAVPPSRALPFFAGLFPHLLAEHSGIPRSPSPGSAVPFLVVDDSGTTGLNGNPHAWEPSGATDNPFYLFFRALGRSGKEGEQRGRWGVGKFVFPMASAANAWFGYTLSSEKREHLLMGRVVLKTHEREGTSYHPDGYWGTRSQENLVLPVTPSEDDFGNFLQLFGLSPRSKPGLTIVVPWLRDDIDREAIRAAVVREYFIPILRDELVVEIDDGPAAPDLLTRATLDAAVTKLGDSQIAELIELARVAVSVSPTELYCTPAADGDGSPRWSDELLDAEARTRIGAILESGGVVGVRVPFQVRPKDKTQASTYFDVFLRESAESGANVPCCVREGITIPDAKLKRLHGTIALVLIDHAPLAALVGDSENPSHTQLLHDLVADKYTKAKMCLTLIRECAAGILSALSGSATADDPLLLAELFPASEEGTGASLAPSRRPGKKSALPEPPPRSAPRYRVSKLADGFSVRGTGEAASLPAELLITCAYEVRRGNPVKKYESWDFAMDDGLLEVSASGADVLERAENRLRVSPTVSDFAVTVTGFDPNRNLFVRIT